MYLSRDRSSDAFRPVALLHLTNLLSSDDQPLMLLIHLVTLRVFMMKVAIGA
eukprot:CAMPEP_0201889184 /NCGR_PEP_ID=MMETSP0902-20130614/29358_1 /ASSEMBLY_ACC=CAM_ASM_000551 /TAXON_ID=420261 /ORGANISM="Thalassiosira antarctica, Strain CCMP982" /LENGTH=51 /DNA_ID=CAMNT_0048419671 /DNA_START=292 /DNA_END=443 /DNA_ORIENTATION=+